jgi:catechol 2,3-dioxygenase-like lactoylglutathione lyase family enzyme
MTSAQQAAIEPRASHRVSPAKLAHVVFRTPRFAEMKTWYLALLNARVAHENEALAFLSYDLEHHRVALINIPGIPDRQPGVGGVDHVAFTYNSLTDLYDTYARLKAEDGIAPFWAINHGPTTSLYYRDPDGNQVELQVDNFDTDEQGIAFFLSSEFAENPIGVDFDPDELGRRLAAGESEAALKVRPNTGPRGLADGVPLQ